MIYAILITIVISNFSKFIKPFLNFLCHISKYKKQRRRIWIMKKIRT